MQFVLRNLTNSVTVTVFKALTLRMAEAFSFSVFQLT